MSYLDEMWLKRKSRKPQKKNTSIAIETNRYCKFGRKNVESKPTNRSFNAWIRCISPSQCSISISFTSHPFSSSCFRWFVSVLLFGWFLCAMTLIVIRTKMIYWWENKCHIQCHQKDSSTFPEFKKKTQRTHACVLLQGKCMREKSINV